MTISNSRTDCFSKMVAFCLMTLSLLAQIEGGDLLSFTAREVPQIQALSESLATEYNLDPGFYEKATVSEGILIVSSEKVSDNAHLEAAYQFGMIMQRINNDIAQRIREQKVLCLLIGHDELTSQLPQFASDKTGEELDFYNWRNRGFLSRKNGRPVVVFAEEDVLEYEGGMQEESILIHEFGHVVHIVGFDKGLQDRLTECYETAIANGLYNDGRAAQRFRRVKGDQPVKLLTALIEWFPAESPVLLKKCLDSGDILVNGKPTDCHVEVTEKDKVLIMFGGDKKCYATRNRSEYWAEGFQCWYNTNRTMDHDHNHLQTREQLKDYDKPLAQLCSDVLGNPEWRFVSPRERAGEGHLKYFDPKASPTVVDLPHIQKAANDYYDGYWREFWQRLRDKHNVKTHPIPWSENWLIYKGGIGPGAGKHVVLIAADQEYRSEQVMPMLAKILSKRHGFDCTVLFSLNDKGEVDPTQKIRWQDKTVIHDVPGLEHLTTADLMILFSRLITLPDEQIQHIIDYLESGKAVIGIRTANHGFLENFPYEIDSKQVRFGEDVLGGSFRSHHGNWHRDSTRGIILEEAKDHPILTGVSDIWGPSDVYRTYPEGKSLPEGCIPLVMGQPLSGRSPDDKPNPKKIPLPIAWTNFWTGSTGKTARVFHVTMGSAKDYQSSGLRRMTVNAAYWCLNMEVHIDAKSSVDYIGEYTPLRSGFNYEKLNVVPQKPEALQ